MENIILNEEKSLLLQVQASLNNAINALRLSLRTDNSSFRTNLPQNEFTLRTISSYEDMLSSPYYARYDFIYSGDDTVTKIYVTQNNVTFDLPEINATIIPWHMPLAQTLQYATVGYINLASEHIEGKLLLKRIINIRDGKILNYSTTGETSLSINEPLAQEIHDDIKYVDSYITELLKEHSSSKLKTILSSVQVEQNKLITAPKESSVIINGCAGSGKSSILLLRLAYLAHRYNVPQDDILVLSPSKLFKNYMSKSFSDIDLYQINTMTWNELLVSIIPSQNLPSNFNNQLEEFTNFKDSLDFMKLLDVYTDYLRVNILKVQDIKLLGTTLIEGTVIEDIFNNQLSTLPLNQRIDKFKKLFKEYCDNSFKKLLTDLYKKYLSEQKVHQTIITDSSAITTIIDKLNKEYDIIKDRLNDSYTLLTSAYLDQLDAFNIKHEYFNLITNIPLLKELAAQTNITLSEYTLNTITNVSSLDLIPYIYLYIKIVKLPVQKIKYLLIDEVQDISPLLIKVLTLLFPYSIITYLGDENQSSLPDFKMDTLLKNNSNKINMINLNVSYRNSYEITLLAREVLKKKKDIRILPTPINRSSVTPDVLEASTIEGLYEQINSLCIRYQTTYTSIAIICKSQKMANSLYSALSSHLNAQLLTNMSDQYHDGTIITTIHAVKGLEFDAVILPDVDAINYPSNSYNDLYGAITRALHCISLLYTGKLSPLLDDISTEILEKNIVDCISRNATNSTDLSLLQQYVYSQISTIYGKETARSYKDLLNTLSEEDLQAIVYELSSDREISLVLNNYLK